MLGNTQRRPARVTFERVVSDIRDAILRYSVSSNVPIDLNNFRYDIFLSHLLDEISDDKMLKNSQYQALRMLSDVGISCMTGAYIVQLAVKGITSTLGELFPDLFFDQMRDFTFEFISQTDVIVYYER